MTGPSWDPQNERPWLLWDGQCGFCCYWVRWVRHRGGDRVFRISAYQDAPSPPMSPERRAAAARAVLVVHADGRETHAGRAVIEVLEGLGWRRRARALRGVLPVVELGYRWVARNRGFLARFMSQSPSTCRDGSGG